MFSRKNIKIADYEYLLPDSSIAKHPLSERDNSKLLIYKKGEISESIFKMLPGHLPEKSLLVFNNTRVIHARLVFTKPTGARIEIFCLEPIEPSNYELSLSSKKGTTWKCLVGNLKKWKNDVLNLTVQIDNTHIVLKATKIKQEDTNLLIKFTWDHSDITFSEIIEKAGTIPIPPYLNREAEISDNHSYQTVYACNNGSVAAPTAGLHFTEPVLNELKNKKIEKLELTLHVGAGTFKPVTEELISNHEMHSEHFYIGISQIQKLIEKSNSIIAVGTTSVRTLESLYWLGIKISLGKVQSDKDLYIDQWDPYGMQPMLSVSESLSHILEYLNKNHLQSLEGITRIIIVPGYKFNIVKGLLTNYHMPRSTLLLLIAAFIGNDWKTVYDFALNNNFRFLSYGDSSLLIP